MYKFDSKTECNTNLYHDDHERFFIIMKKGTKPELLSKCSKDMQQVFITFVFLKLYEKEGSQETFTSHTMHAQRFDHNVSLETHFY